jgi:hypothetical protein
MARAALGAAMTKSLRPLAALALVAAAFAGCASTDEPPATTTPAPPAPEPFEPDCSIASSWGQACLAWASPNESPGKAEIDIAVSPTDPANVFVASKDLDRSASDCVWAVGQATFDGGSTWNTTYVGGQRKARQPGDALYGWQCITDPILAYGADGTLYYALQVYQLHSRNASTPVGINSAGVQMLAVSRDGGRTFPEIVLLDPSDQLVTFDDYMRIDVSPKTGTVFVVWQQLTGLVTGAGVIGRSIAEVAAYEPSTGRARPAVLLADSVLAASASGIQVDRNGTVYAWMGGFNGPDAAFLSVSQDDGRTFTAPRQAFEYEPMTRIEGVEFRHGTAVELAVDRSATARDGCLYAAWAGKDLDASGPSDVLVRRSCDRGATWADPVRVHDAVEGAQFMPRITVDDAGVLHAVYLTQAYSAEGLLDAEHAYSLDGGGNWTARRLTSVSFDGDLGLHQDGFPFIGDYIGIASAKGHTYAAFPVTQTGRAEIAVASLGPHAGAGSAP